MGAVRPQTLHRSPRQAFGGELMRGLREDLDFWQHHTELEAGVPRVDCPQYGVLQAAVPWARAGSGFTFMLEAMILLLCQQMPVAAAAWHFGGNGQAPLAGD